MAEGGGVMGKLLENTIRNVNNFQSMIRNELFKVDKILEPLGLELKIDAFGSAYISEQGKYFCPVYNECFFGEDDRADRLSELVSNLEFPVLESEALPICDLLEISEEHRAKIIKECESIEARQAFEDYEKRIGLY